jgi:hypothetical protein
MRIPARFLIATLLITGVVTASQQGGATVLMLGTGHNGTVLYDVGATPPDYNFWYALAVVEGDKVRRALYWRT